SHLAHPGSHALPHYPIGRDSRHQPQNAVGKAQKVRPAMRIRLIMLGKTRRQELRAVFDDYVKRLGHSCPVEVNEVRDADAAIKRLDADRAATALLLDAAGKPDDSQSLARWLAEQRDRGAREVIFVCGDADGFPGRLRERVTQKLSLS